MTSERAEFVKSLAQEIRRVDGRHDLGADALAEALTPWIESQAVAGEAVYQYRDVYGGWRDTTELGLFKEYETRTLYTAPQPASVDLLQIEAWLRTQRNNIPATGEEFADALRYCFITNANPTVPVDAAVGRDAAKYRFVLESLVFENDQDPDSGDWYSHAYFNTDSITAPGSPYYDSADEVIEAALTAQQQERS